MLQFLLIGLGGLVAFGAAILRPATDDKDSSPEAFVHSLGSFVIWGRPNVGKTTFIARLRGLDPAPKEKETSPSRVEYTDITLEGLVGGDYVIDKIVDIPGTEDRLKDWLGMVATESHVFYMIDLSRLDDAAYMSRVRLDVAETVKALAASAKKRKRINIIASHVDESKWGASKDNPQLHNLLQADPEIRALYESLSDVSGYIYSGDLTDKASFQRLLQGVVNDCTA